MTSEFHARKWANSLYFSLLAGNSGGEELAETACSAIQSRLAPPSAAIIIIIPTRAGFRKRIAELRRFPVTF